MEAAEVEGEVAELDDSGGFDHPARSHIHGHGERADRSEFLPLACREV
jgi:hypothetical protein